MKKKELNRACIYFIYDKDGIIDKYILYQLNDLRENVGFLHCVINGQLVPDGYNALSEIADEVYVRENKGNDVGAYKAAIRRIGWKKLSEYDELILMNNTCYGPLYPFKEAFDWAASKDIQIWGLTYGQKVDWTGTTDYIHYNKSKTHIQSYFLAVRKPLLGSKLLMDFFEEIPDDTSYVLSGSYYEYAFPGYFEDKGYKADVYCDDSEDTNYPLLYNPIHLVKDYRMPLFKKRSFTHHYTDVMNNTAGEATVRLMRFIQEETDYDMDMVWENLLRTSSLSDIVRCAQLNRVLPRDYVIPGQEHAPLKVGIVFHAYYPDLFDENISFIDNFPKDAGILITTNTREKKELLKEKLKKINRTAQVLVISNRGRDVSSLLVGGADFVFNYDLVCFTHDKKTKQVLPNSVGRSWAYKINENLYPTKAFVENVINLFAREKRLGMAFPSNPNHSGYLYAIGNGWSGNFYNTQKLLKDFGVDVKINEHTLCVAPLGTCFWFRPEGLKRLFQGYKGEGWSYSDFPCEPNRTDQTILHAIERAYAYFAQSEGYYPVYLYSDQFSQIEFTNLEYGKSGSEDMRRWIDQLALGAIGYNQPGGAGYEQSDQPIEPSGRLRQTASALAGKHPVVWKALKPVRWFATRVLRIKA